MVQQSRLVFSTQTPVRASTPDASLQVAVAVLPAAAVKHARAVDALHLNLELELRV
jgi:hypothetical protein